MKLSIIIPVYNEENSIKPLFKEIKEALVSVKDYEIIFVNDGSTDSSLSVLTEIKDNKVKIVDFTKNFGQSAAMKAGFDLAKGEIIVTMDGDLQNDSKDIIKLVKKIDEGYDVVSGWRHKRQDALSKKIPSLISNYLHRKVTGLKIHDSGCSLKAYRRKFLKDIELYGEMHRFIPALLSMKGCSVVEVEVNHRHRKYGRSKYGAKRLVKGFLDLLDIEFWLHFSKRPLHVFGSVGLIFCFFGAGLAFALFLFRILKLYYLSTSVLPLLSTFVFLLGIEFLALGILADVLIKVYYSQSKRKTYFIRKIY